MSIVRRFRQEWLTLILLCLAAFFVNNSLLPVGGGEAKVLVTARDIVDGGNWLAPTMNGEPRYDKPPLASWVAALVQSIHADNISAQRTVAGLLGIVWTMFFFGITRYFSRRRGFAEIATVVFITTYNIIYMGRMVERDIYGYAFMMVAIYFMMRMFFDSQYFANPHKWRWAWLAGLAMGLSLLGNGLVAVYSMLMPWLVAIVLFKRPDMTGRWGPLLLLVVLAILPYGMWLWYIQIYHPEAAPESWGFLPARWTEKATRPWYYYWRFFAEMGIWSLILLAALLFPFWKKRIRTRRVYRFALAWLANGLVILASTPHKEMVDLVALTPPCAIAVTCVLYYYEECWPKEKVTQRFFLFNGYLIALIMFGLPIFMLIRMFGRDLIDFGTAIFLWVLLWGIAMYTALSTKRHSPKGVVRGVALLFFFIECFMLTPIVGVLGNNRKVSINQVSKVSELKQLPFYYNQDEELKIEVVYEVGKKVSPININDPDAVSKATPFALITQQPLAKEMNADVLSRVDTLRVGVYDDNTLPRHNQHYKKEFINQVSILKKKQAQQ